MPEPDGRSAAQDRPRGNGVLQPLHAVNGTICHISTSTDDVPLPTASTARTPAHLPARAHRATGEPDTSGSPELSQRERTFPTPVAHSRTRVSCARRRALRISWSTFDLAPRNRTHPLEHSPRPFRRTTPTGERRSRRPRRPAPLPGSPARSCQGGTPLRRRAPRVLATDFRRTSREELSAAVVRAIALVEQEAESEGAPPMLTMRANVTLDPAADEP